MQKGVWFCWGREGGKVSRGAASNQKSSNHGVLPGVALFSGCKSTATTVEREA